MEMDLRNVGAMFQKRTGLHVPLPHRNLVFLSFAAGVATTTGALQIVIGLTADDFLKDVEVKGKCVPYASYETGTEAFVAAFRHIMKVIAQ